jgi:hypothetical protein
MLRIQIIGLALVSAVLMSAVAAGSASAEAPKLHQWLIVHLIGGEEVHLLLSLPNKVHSLGLILLRDDTPPIGGPTEVHCHFFNDGYVGPHGLDLILDITSTLLGTNKKITCNITVLGACKSGTTATFEAIHLPWLTHLYLTAGGEVRDRILPDEHGKPGYSVTCTNILGGTTTDTCESEGNSTKMLNVAGGVEAIFDIGPNSEAGECKIGGEAARQGAGLISGSVLIESPSATLHLRISFGT